jgi:hypothetical protein
MSGSMEALRKRIEALERKRSAERHPSLPEMADLSLLSDEELHQLVTMAERCEGLAGPVVDVSLLTSEDRAVLQALAERTDQAQQDRKNANDIAWRSMQVPAEACSNDRKRRDQDS